jgi:hypothetical protein
MKIVCIIFINANGIIVTMPIFVIICKDINGVGNTLLNNKFFTETIHTFSDCTDAISDLVISILNGLIYGYDVIIQRYKKGNVLAKYYHKCTSKYIPEDGCNRLLCTILYNSLDNKKLVVELCGIGKRFVHGDDARSIVIGKTGWAKFSEGNIYFMIIIEYI